MRDKYILVRGRASSGHEKGRKTETERRESMNNDEKKRDSLKEGRRNRERKERGEEEEGEDVIEGDREKAAPCQKD